MTEPEIARLVGGPRDGQSVSVFGPRLYVRETLRSARLGLYVRSIDDPHRYDWKGWQ